MSTNATNPKGAAAEEPNVGGVRLRPTLTVGLFVLLVASAALALWVERNAATAAPGLVLAAPWIFLAFAVGFSIYRLSLVAAKRYSAFKAFFQVGVAALFFMLILPGPPKAQSIELPKDRDWKLLLQDPNPKVRALTASLARFEIRWKDPVAKEQHQNVARALVTALEDEDALVREEAHRTLVLIVGKDLGPAISPEARTAWKAAVP
ncbi:MAG: hypothetical protein K1X64_22000 [Myxococcaceae bacterium]|nr:hypothetical protein [Myxococcaceae bacterium]